MNIRLLRHNRVADTMAAIRKICRTDKTICRSTLHEMESELRKLAAAPELFPADAFSIEPGETLKLFRLSEDEDHKFALYYHMANGPASVAPHNHTTWACIAGISGTEENTLYNAKDGGAPIATEKKTSHQGTQFPCCRTTSTQLKPSGQNRLQIFTYTAWQSIGFLRENSGTKTPICGRRLPLSPALSTGELRDALHYPTRVNGA